MSESLDQSPTDITIEALSRVEGEGGLLIRTKDGAVTDVELRIFEPPRFFEAFLRGRHFTEAPDITARICGICPVAYQMSAVHAMENALGVKVDGQLRALRRLLYCGEWIESHTLHVYMLHAPDFLGFPSAIEMAKQYPDIVKRGLALKKAGNEILKFLGGREIHPINVRVGGFYRVPGKSEWRPLIETFKRAREMAIKTVHWVSGFDFPELQHDYETSETTASLLASRERVSNIVSERQYYEFVALSHPEEYPFNEGRIRSSKGLDISAEEYEKHFIEEQVPYSNALHSTLRGHDAYFVGPMARYNLNFKKLSAIAKEAAYAANLGETCNNPFKSIIVRSVEVLYACDEALRIMEAYEVPDRSFVPAEPRSATGYACTEAPRGMLYHRYALDNQGDILEAKIVPPTSQNQKTIENDLRQFVSANIQLPKEKLTWECEQAVRNYDPCISCATHFLKLEIEEVSGTGPTGDIQ